MSDVESLIEKITISTASMSRGEIKEFAIDGDGPVYEVSYRLVDLGLGVKVEWRAAWQKYDAFLIITKL